MALQLTLTQIAAAVNNNKAMRSFFGSYLRGKNGKLNANDIRKLLNTPLSSVFKRMFITAVTAYENIAEGIRANIRDIIKVEENSEHVKLHQYEDRDSETNWGSIDNDGQKLQLKPHHYTIEEIAERLVEFRTILPQLMKLLVILLAKFQLMFTSHRLQTMELARQHELVFSPMHARHLYNTYQAYHLTNDPVIQNQIVHSFTTMQGAPLLEARLHRFFRSAPLKDLFIKHERAQNDLQREVTRTNDDIIYCQQACVRLASPLNYTMNQMFMRNPNFEFTPKPGRNRYNVSELQREADRLTPFNLELRPEQHS